MSTYTLHVTIRAENDEAAVGLGDRIIRLLDEHAQPVGIDDWDVSTTDDSGAQDWSVLVPR